MEKVIDVLDRMYPQFNTVSPHHAVSDALYQMCCENVDYLIVLADEKFLGILTEHDIAKKALLANMPLTEMKVSDLMNREVPVATANDSVSHCMHLLDRYNTRYLAIYDGFDFKGVISSYDLIQQSINKRKVAFGQLLERNEYP